MKNSPLPSRLPVLTTVNGSGTNVCRFRSWTDCLHWSTLSSWRSSSRAGGRIEYLCSHEEKIRYFGLQPLLIEFKEKKLAKITGCLTLNTHFECCHRVQTLHVITASCFSFVKTVVTFPTLT